MFTWYLYFCVTVTLHADITGAILLFTVQYCLEGCFITKCTEINDLSTQDTFYVSVTLHVTL